MIELALFLLTPQGDYDGRFADHPNRPEIAQEVWNTAQYAADDLPKWLARRTPSVEVDLVDLEQPLERHVWPGDVDAKVEIELEGRECKISIALPIDTYIASPHLARYSLLRVIFGAASTARAMQEGADVTTLPHWGLENPLVEAMAAHWAGTLDREIEFVLRRHLSSDEELTSLVKPIVVPADGGFGLERGAPDDLTWFLLVKRLAPKENDRKLETLYSAVEKGQSLEGALKKASRKDLDRLDRDLAELHASYVEERFPARRRERFREAQRAFEEEDWVRLLGALAGLKATDFLASHISFYLGCAMAGIGEDQGGVDWRLLLEHGVWYDELALCPEVMRRAAKALAERGREADARELWEVLRDEYGWLPGVRAEAEAALE